MRPISGLGVTCKMSAPGIFTHNAVAIPLPEYSPLEQFREALATGPRICAFYGRRLLQGCELYAVWADDEQGNLRIARSFTEKETWPSLTSVRPELHLFERELQEQTGLKLEGHPRPWPVRYLQSDLSPAERPHYQIDGELVSEVLLGPVYGESTPPGLFRFQCAGEETLHLEASLGFNHRHCEADLVQTPGTMQGRLALKKAELVAGDSSVAHSGAYCQALEGLMAVQLTPRAQAIRAVMLELERLANHLGDLEFMARAISFGPAVTCCARLRNDYLKTTARLCGNHFARGLNWPGGISYEADPGCLSEIRDRVLKAAEQTEIAIRWFDSITWVQNRLEGIGIVTEDEARQLGLVGLSARASGLQRDVRCNHPLGYYQILQIPIESVSGGDVWARALMRIMEYKHSVQFIQTALENMPQGPMHAGTRALKPSAMVVSMTEGFRGETVYILQTDPSGRISHCKIVDPTFHNCAGLEMAMRNEAISEFPLCLRSFNLSFSGYDL